MSTTRIENHPLFFWWSVFIASLRSTFTAEETKGKLMETALRILITLLAGAMSVIILGQLGVLYGVGKNVGTLAAVFISALMLRFFTNLIVIPSSLYFSVRRDADKIIWGDVKSSIWKQPNDSFPDMVGVRLEREESHSVQYLMGVLQSIAKDGKIIYAGRKQLPILKDNDSESWTKSFDNTKPRRFLLATIEDGKMRIKTMSKNEAGEQVIEFLYYENGKHTVLIGFTAEGGVKEHIFKGLLTFDGRKIDLKRLSS